MNNKLSHEGALRELERVWAMLHKEREKYYEVQHESPEPTPKKIKTGEIVEIIPDDYPEWAKAAFAQGQFFRIVIERDQQKQDTIEAQAAYIKDLQKASRVMRMSEWISVEKRLPEKSGFWLCWSWKNKPDNGHAKIAWFAKNQIRWETNETVTHWMPLPEPPAENENE